MLYKSCDACQTHPTPRAPLTGEKEVLDKKKAKAEKKKTAEAVQESVAALSRLATGAGKPSAVQSLHAVTTKKLKKKAIRLKRNHMVRRVTFY